MRVILYCKRYYIVTTILLLEDNNDDQQNSIHTVVIKTYNITIGGLTHFIVLYMIPKVLIYVELRIL